MKFPLINSEDGIIDLQSLTKIKMVEINWSINYSRFKYCWRLSNLIKQYKIGISNKISISNLNSNPEGIRSTETVLIGFLNTVPTNSDIEF